MFVECCVLNLIAMKRTCIHMRTCLDFGIGSDWISVCSLSSNVQSCLSRLWLNSARQSVWRATEAERSGQNAVSEPTAIVC